MQKVQQLAEVIQSSGVPNATVARRLVHLGVVTLTRFSEAGAAGVVDVAAVDGSTLLTASLEYAVVSLLHDMVSHWHAILAETLDDVHSGIGPALLAELPR